MFSDELRAGAAEIWEAQYAHPFVRGVADGTLPAARFAFYVRQDYAFLADYGRALALAAARAPRLDWTRRLAEIATATLGSEMDLHRGYARRWGIDDEQLEAERAHPTTRAYTDFLLRTASTDDFAGVIAALTPCMWGYSELGRRLARDGGSPEPRYAEWIAAYADDEFAELADWCRAVCDELGAQAPAPIRARMTDAFRRSSEHELAFWEAAWTSESESPTGFLTS